jgi:hypothetical protein
MSGLKQNSITAIKMIAARLVQIIFTARTQNVVESLDSQLEATKLVVSIAVLLRYIIDSFKDCSQHQVVQDHSEAPCMPHIIMSCSRELQRSRGEIPQAPPNWCSMGHDDPLLANHAWRAKFAAWDALNDHSCDLPRELSGLNLANTEASSTGCSLTWNDKGKGKATEEDEEDNRDSRKRQLLIERGSDDEEVTMSKRLKWRQEEDVSDFCSCIVHFH